MQGNRFRKISRERLDQILQRKEVLIADARTPEYFRSGSIAGAINLYPTRKFVNHLHTLANNKKKPIVIFANETNDEEVVASANYAEQLGFENVYVSDFKSLRDD